MSDAGFTVEAAIAELDALPKKEETPAQATATPAETPDTEIEGDPTPETPNAAETPSEGEEAETDEVEAEEPEPIDPPQFWDADAKKRFGELPRDLQELVLAKEAERVKATSEKFEEAATVRKAAQAEASRLSQFTASLDKLIPQAQATFKGRWEGVDWDKVVDQYGADQALKFRNQFETERDQLQHLEGAKAAVEQHEIQQFKIARDEQFKTVIPEFVDPKEGPKRQEEVVSYLTKQGIAPDVIVNRASAAELAIAYKAMQWDKAQANASTLARTPKPATPARAPVRPTAAPARGSSQSAAVKSLQGRFDADPSVENLTALMNAQG